MSFASAFLGNHYWVGNAVEELARRTADTVLVARPPIAADGFRSILVPVDFDHPPDPQLKSALSLASDGAELELLHCWHLPSCLDESWGQARSPVMGQIRDATVERIKARLNELRVRYRRPGISLFTREVEAVAQQGIRDQLNEDYDLVVLGSHSRWSLRKWLLGSIADTTIRHARCSVLVVKS